MTKMTAEQVANMLRTKANEMAAMSVKDKKEVGGWGYVTGVLFAATAIREHLIETDEQLCERFEAWCVRCDWYTGRLRSGKYASDRTHDLWVAWQAALTWRGETKGGEA